MQQYELQLAAVYMEALRREAIQFRRGQEAEANAKAINNQLTRDLGQQRELLQKLSEKCAVLQEQRRLDQATISRLSRDNLLLEEENSKLRKRLAEIQEELAEE